MDLEQVNRIPVATYRLQLHRGFTFEDVAECLDYLERLGITDCYFSPILEAREGSAHGYDVVDPTRVSSELGGESGLARLHADLRRRNMGILLDIVPNHMCVAGGQNPWWDDVLRHGKSSPYSHVFDIDWGDGESDDVQKIVLPFLGTSLEAAVENLDLSVGRTDAELFIEYAELRFPLAPGSLTSLLEPAARRLERQKKEASELRFVLEELEQLRSSHHVGNGTHEEARAVSDRLTGVMRASPDVREAIDARVNELNRNPSGIRDLLLQQHYELADWREAGQSGSYRRFFDINELAGVRVEDPEVFQATHEKILDLVSRGVVTGLRVDHIDGLRVPGDYLARLPVSCFTVVEKILEGAEPLPTQWPVAGTTGYEFLEAVNGVFVETSHEKVFRRRYEAFVRRDESFDDIVYRCKKLVLETSFTGDLRRLARVAEKTGVTALVTAPQERIVEAFSELAACFPVYRSYVGASDGTLRTEDRGAILMALGRAKGRASAELEPILETIGELLQLAGLRGAAPREVVLRFQQLTSAVMAKGFEDTALYRYFPLASVNDVGANPERFGVDVDLFHRRNRQRRERWRHGLSATSTHDTKRSEDVRARLNVLSELGEEWWDTVSSWQQLNRMQQERELDPNDEYLLYQTIVGAWPAAVPDEKSYEEFIDRIQAYMRKALRESKAVSSWVAPDEDYEEAMSRFIASILDTSRGAEFLEALMGFLSPILDAGFFNSIAQTLLKIASPGIPDFYQGTELWEYTLVDPDNRRPVDFERRRTALAEIDEAAAHGDYDGLIEKLLADPSDGRLKLLVTSRGLRFRREHRALFGDGHYVPLRVSGTRKHHVVAFARTRPPETAIVAVGRFFTRLPAPPTQSAWSDTKLELGELEGAVFRDVVTGREIRTEDGTIPLEEVFARLPFVLLEKSG